MRHSRIILSFITASSIGACHQDDASIARDKDQTSQPQGSSSVPAPLEQRLEAIDACHNDDTTNATFPHQTIQGEAPPIPPNPPVLYAYYLLDENGLDTPFTTPIPGVTDSCQTPVHATRGQSGAIASVRAVVEPKTGEVCDTRDPRSFIDIFTDICGIEVINNESGWYEGWLIHFLTVPRAVPATNGAQPFGTISPDDAVVLAAIGDHLNVPGNTFTIDGKAPRGDIHPGGDPSSFTPQNRVPIYVSLGAYNALQGHDAHSYWELNEYTNWSFPYYELFSTGGRILDPRHPNAVLDFYQNGFQYSPLGLGPNADSRIPGSGPNGVLNNTTLTGKVTFGDDPALPRDADRTPEACNDNDDQAETRLRFIPSGLARQVLIDAFLRRVSFEPQQQDIVTRLYDAYAFEVAKIDTNHDGIISFVEGDIDGTSDGGQPNRRLYLAPLDWQRIVVTREINDGLLAPRFAPTEQGYVLNGDATFLLRGPCPGSDE